MAISLPPRPARRFQLVKQPQQPALRYSNYASINLADNMQAIRQTASGCIAAFMLLYRLF
jgi:hypothetical protein